LERLVDEDHGGNAAGPCSNSVAHGGAGAGPSGADADDEIVDGLPKRAEAIVLERHPRVRLVCTLDARRLTRRLDAAFEPRPKPFGRLILVPHETEAQTHRAIEVLHGRLLRDFARAAQRTDELD